MTRGETRCISRPAGAPDDQARDGDDQQPVPGLQGVELLHHAEVEAEDEEEADQPQEA